MVGLVSSIFRDKADQAAGGCGTPGHRSLRLSPILTFNWQPSISPRDSHNDGCPQSGSQRGSESGRRKPAVRKSALSSVSHGWRFPEEISALSAPFLGTKLTKLPEAGLEKIATFACTASDKVV